MGLNWNGRRATLIDWVATAAILAVFSLLLYGGVSKDWSEHGVPRWYQSYLKWEKRVGFPVWWPL